MLNIFVYFCGSTQENEKMEKTAAVHLVFPSQQPMQYKWLLAKIISK
jgi:hypothetical protein